MTETTSLRYLTFDQLIPFVEFEAGSRYYLNLFVAE
jgi:hypothetical protein